MNVLEHWIKEIHNIEDLKDGFVKVDVTIDCWGSIERKNREFTKRNWESIKEKGYWAE